MRVTPRTFIHSRPARTSSQMVAKMEHAHLPNTCQYTAKTDRGDYIVQIAWPLIWGEDRVPHKEEPVNTM